MNKALILYQSHHIGYKMVKTGVFSKRGVERKTYEIVPSEAEVVKIIFDLFTENEIGRASCRERV